MRSLTPFVILLACLLVLSSWKTADGVELRIMPLGDSNTRGPEPNTLPGPQSAAIGAGGYRYPLQQMLTSAGYTFDFVGSQTSNSIGEQGDNPPETWTYDPTFDREHQGLAGFTSGMLITGGAVPTLVGDPIIDAPSLVDCLTMYQPDIVLLMSGTNGLSSTNIAAHLQSLDSVIQTITANSPETHVIVSTIFDRWDSAVIYDATKTYNAGIPGLVAEARQRGEFVSFVDCGGALTRNDFCFNGVMGDGVHPNPVVSMPKVAKIWYEGITAAMTTPELVGSIIAHSGQTDPTTEGWTESIDYVPGDPTGTGTASRTGVNDNGTDACKISTDRAWLRYIRNLNSRELAATANGWEASISVRIDTPSYTPGFDANFEVATDNWVTSLLFGTDENGTPLLSYLSDWSFTATPIDLSALDLDSGFHTYKLRATGDTETVSLYVDGNFVTNLTALHTGVYTGWEKRILWGDTERGAVALNAYYSSVDFSINTPEKPIPGDANNDGKVDGSDVTILAGNWQAGVGAPDPATITWAMGDFNGDGQIDGSDVTILVGNWQAGVTTAAASVPEPSTFMMLLSLSSMALLTWFNVDKGT